MATDDSSDAASTAVALQKVTIDLVESVHQLTSRLDRLLALFEDATKNIQALDNDQDLAKKLETLLEQNKTIAHGLVLLEQYIRDRSAPPPKNLPSL